MSKRLTIVVFSFLLILMLSACKGNETTDDINNSELDSSVTFQILKTKAMQTAQAQLTLASILEPTKTPQLPIEELHDSSVTTTSADPMEEHQPIIETPTPFIEQAATLPPEPTYTPWPVNPEYNCQVELIAPSPGERINPNSSFETHWRLTNSGSKLWDHNSIDFVYMEGERLHTSGDIIDLTKNINPGETYDFYIPMQSPPQNGYFQTAWILKRGTLYFCSLNFSIQVENNPN